jgi:Trk K+ transport system NAD-binding subunit
VVAVGHLRGIHAAVPGPETVLLAGDRLYLVVAQGSIKGLVKLLES